MYDLLTTAAIADELSDMLTGGRVQRVGLRDPGTVAFEVYQHHKRQHLVATIGDPEPALYRSDDPFAIDPEIVTPFALLLRKFVRGATLVGAEQLPLERIVHLTFAKRFWAHNRADDEADEDEERAEDERDLTSELVETTLYVELMGRRSNVILVGMDGVVMDSLKRVTPKMSRVRPIWPSVRYVAPPPRDGLDPRRVGQGSVSLLLQTQSPEAPLHRVLVERIQGFSPAMATEAAWRATGDPGAPVATTDLQRLSDVVQGLVAPLGSRQWVPTVYRNEEGAVEAYSAIPFESIAMELEPEPVDSMSRAVEAWQKTEHSIPGRHDGRRNRLLARIAERRNVLNGRVRSVRKQQASVAEAERFRRWGESIYAHLWEVGQGQSMLEVDGERIPLDPLRPAKDVAADYFETYRRMQRGTGEVDAQLEQAQVESDYLDQIETMALLANSFQEIENVISEWDAFAGPERGTQARKRRSSEEGVRPLSDSEGNMIYVGRSGPQNDRVTFTIAGPEDWWLHARGVPGSHVILRGGNREPSDEAVRCAAAIAAYYSKSRTSGKVEVDIARRRDVRKIKGAGPGMVTYRNERTMLVSPCDESCLERG